MKIAIGASRKEKKWVNRDIAWEDFIKRAGSTIRTVETASEYRNLPKNRQDEIKDVGGFVGGQWGEAGGYIVDVDMECAFDITSGDFICCAHIKDERDGGACQFNIEVGGFDCVETFGQFGEEGGEIR